MLINFTADNINQAINSLFLTAAREGIYKEYRKRMSKISKAGKNRMRNNEIVKRYKKVKEMKDAEV